MIWHSNVSKLETNAYLNYSKKSNKNKTMLAHVQLTAIITMSYKHSQ